MVKLTDKQRKQLVADYIECGSYSEVARKYGMSVNGAKKVVQTDKTSARRCKAKKDENTLAMLDYLDSKKDEAQGIISQILRNLRDSERLKDASPREQATVMAIVIDKFLLPNTLRNGIEGNKDDKVQVNINFKDLSGPKDES